MSHHTLSSIHPAAKIGKNVTISPFVTVEEDVVIGDNCWIGPNATIMKGTRMGERCQVFPGAVLGAIPQDLKYQGEYTTLEIGDNTIIRECCTLNKGTKALGKTVVGSNCLLMAYVHVAHDCIVGSNCILANNVTLAGHIEVNDFVILGGMTAVHQFVKIGEHAMIGGGSLVRKDVPPYVKAAREPLSYVGVNSIGLKRRGFDQDQIHNIQDTYRILFVKNNSVRQAIEEVEAIVNPTDERDRILDFVKGADRGLMRGFNSL